MKLDLQALIQNAVNDALGVTSPAQTASEADPIPVVVCTDKRAVVFGYTENPQADPIALTDARMCLYWDKATGGVFGLSENGPTNQCKISATTNQVSLTGVTAVFDVTDTAVKAWASATVQGR